MAELLERRAFVGRAREIARLESILDAVRGGRGRAVVVAGDAGIGKSRLVHRFAESASASGAVTLAGACLRVRQAELPYAPFVELLRQLVRDVPQEALPAILGPGRREIARLVPELGSPTGAAEPESPLERGSQARLFEAILGAVERLARTASVVLVVEDLQWADHGTRDLLTFLVRSLRDARVLLLLTVRTDADDEDPVDATFLAELEREEDVERIDLRPFGRDEVAEQVAALRSAAPDASLVDDLLHRSDGNPFYVEELVVAAASDGLVLPPVLRDVLVARIRPLSASCRDVLRAAAVGGRSVDDELLSAVLSIPPRAVAAALREAVAAGIVVADESGGGVGSAPPRSFAPRPRWAFRHELLREVIDAESFPAERAGLHGAFAEALETRRSGGVEVSPAEIAHHWDAAGRPDRAFGPTVSAARAAEGVYAFADALALWRRAADLGALAPAASRDIARSALLEHAAESAVLAGEYESAVELGRAAIDAERAALPTDDDPGHRERLAHLGDRLRWFVWESGDRATAALMVEEALRTLPAAVATAPRARALGQRAGIALYGGRYEEARSDAADAVAVARAAGAVGEEAFALGVLGWSEAVLGDIPAGIERLREATRLAEGLGSVEGIALGASNLVSLLDRVGMHREELAAALDGYEMTRRLGVARTYGGLLLAFAAKSQVVLGLWDDADRATLEGLRLRPTGRTEMWLLVNRGRLLACRGEFAVASSLLARARSIDEHAAGTEFRAPLLAALAELAVWSGAPADAHPIVRAGLSLEHRDALPDPGLAWLAALGLRALADEAEVARARRDQEAAIAIASEAEPLLDAVRRGSRVVTSARLADVRAGALGALIAAERERLEGRSSAATWAGVAAHWAELGRPLDEAYARFRQAEAILASRGEREEAAGALAAAYRIAAALGAAPLRSEVELLARQARLAIPIGAVGGDTAGTRSRPADSARGTAATGPDVSPQARAAAAYGFTERELEVLRLVAGGWTNQQIADALFIARKTASVHVSNILGKLGVGSRVEAAAIAHRIGLGADAPPPPDADPSGDAAR